MARRSILTILLIAVAVPASAVGSAKQAREIRALRHQVATLKTAATGLGNQLERVTRERDAARADLVSAQVDNNNLRAGLPDAIKAVPVDRFWELVFTPAREAWRCDSLYESTGYWSLDFTSDC